MKRRRLRTHSIEEAGEIFLDATDDASGRDGRAVPPLRRDEGVVAMAEVYESERKKDDLEEAEEAVVADGDGVSVAVKKAAQT
ncbi:hypothetical protein L2E82_32138 [Cichorium intybus]|uniref:Uncharacterized protein n=1 Tax=Cichorium intybus TaxID=13427 RepID=A0ACB9BGS1_CICIN|nr:hypothetical protein L2E82_32138 [Cichorium intybus]